MVIVKDILYVEPSYGWNIDPKQLVHYRVEIPFEKILELKKRYNELKLKSNIEKDFNYVTDDFQKLKVISNNDQKQTVTIRVTVKEVKTNFFEKSFYVFYFDNSQLSSEIIVIINEENEVISDRKTISEIFEKI